MEKARERKRKGKGRRGCVCNLPGDMLQVAVCMLHVTAKWGKAAWQSSQQRVIADDNKKTARRKDNGEKRKMN